MLRSAPLLSFALHAAVLVIVGRWSYPTPPRVGSAESVVGVSFSAGAGALLVESAPSPADEAAPTLLPPAPEFAPSTLAIETPPPELLTAATSPIPAPLIDALLQLTSTNEEAQAAAEAVDALPAVDIEVELPGPEISAQQLALLAALAVPPPCEAPPPTLAPALGTGLSRNVEGRLLCSSAL